MENTKEYELLYFISITHEGDSIAAIKQKISELIIKQKGTIIKEEEIGKKKLAFSIKNARHGYYILVHFSVDPNRVNDINKTIHLVPEIIRHKIVIKQNYQPIPPAETDKAEKKAEEINADQTNVNTPEPAEQKTALDSETGKISETKPASASLKAKEDAKVDIAELDRKIDELLSEHEV